MSKRIQKKLKNIHVLVTDTLIEQNNIELTALIELLPSDLQVRAKRYKNKQSAINYCFGRLLLIRAISNLGFDSGQINQIYYSENDKPFIDGFSFSISHAENYVALAYSTDCQLGLDIEHTKKVVLKNFRSFFRDDEWEIINSAENPLQKFYWFWVRKESILKAEDGKMNQIKDIFITAPVNGYFKNRANLWHFSEVDIAENFIGVLACEIENVEISIDSFGLYE